MTTDAEIEAATRASIAKRTAFAAGARMGSDAESEAIYEAHVPPFAISNLSCGQTGAQTFSEAHAVDPQAGVGSLVATASVPGVLVSSEPPVVHMPISWAQLVFGTISDYLNPAVILAFLVVVSTWLASGTPITTRTIVTVLVSASIAAMQAVIHMTGNDGLARRLKSTGQLKQ